MNAGAKNLMKMKKKTFKDLSLKVRDILFFNAHCFEKMMKAGGENSFDYKAFFEIISKEELLSDLKRYQILKGAFLSANKAYQAYKAQTKLFDLDEVDFSVSPDQMLQQIGFFYDVYLKSRALETYYDLRLKINAGEKLQKKEEEKFKSMNVIYSDLESYLVQKKMRAVERMFLTCGEGRILFTSQKVQSHLKNIL